MSGIDRAFEAGYDQVKVNAVLLKNMNSQELPAFMNWIKDRPIQLRFIELMQTGEMDSMFEKHHLSGTHIRARLVQDGWIPKVREANDGPAQVFIHPDYAGEIGPYHAL